MSTVDEFLLSLPVLERDAVRAGILNLADAGTWRDRALVMFEALAAGRELERRFLLERAEHLPLDERAALKRALMGPSPADEAASRVELERYGGTRG